MPAKEVKAYVKRNKNDAADAEAICEAVRRPTMRFLAAKSRPSSRAGSASLANKKREVLALLLRVDRGRSHGDNE
jgi:transposase